MPNSTWHTLLNDHPYETKKFFPLTMMYGMSKFRSFIRLKWKRALYNFFNKNRINNLQRTHDIMPNRNQSKDLTNRMPRRTRSHSRRRGWKEDAESSDTATYDGWDKKFPPFVCYTWACLTKRAGPLQNQSHKWAQVCGSHLWKAWFGNCKLAMDQKFFCLTYKETGWIPDLLGFYQIF